MLPDPEVQPLIKVWPDAGQWLGLGSRSASYAAAERGEIPVVRIGSRMFVPVAELRRKYGLDPRPRDGGGSSEAVG